MKSCPRIVENGRFFVGGCSWLRKWESFVVVTRHFGLGPVSLFKSSMLFETRMLHDFDPVSMACRFQWQWWFVIVESDSIM